MSEPFTNNRHPYEHPAFRSTGEARLARCLDDYAIRYEYEKAVLVYDRTQPKIWHPDFYLPNFAIYIEYYGGAGQPDYDRGIDRKTAVYAANGLDVIPLYPWTFLDEWQDYVADSLEAITSRRMDLLPQGAYVRSPVTQYTRGLLRAPDTYARQAGQEPYARRHRAGPAPDSPGPQRTYRV